MRITDQMMYQNMAQNIDQAQAAYVRTQQEASSGVSISQPSDNPAGTATILQLEAAQQQVTAWQSNANSAQSQMQVADQTLGQIENAVNSATSLASEGASQTNTLQETQDMAAQAAQILGDVGALANTQYQGLYIFSGVQQIAPVTSTGSGSSTVYTPSSEQTTAGGVVAQSVEIGHAVQIPVSVDASSVLGGTQYASGTAYSALPAWLQQRASALQAQALQQTPPGTGVLTPASGPTSSQTTTVAFSSSLVSVLGYLQQDLSSGNAAAVEADLGELQAQAGTLTNVRAALGANMNRVEAAVSQLQSTNTTLQTEQGSVENVDMAQIVAQLTAEQTAYQAAVAAGAQMKLPTLANYLT